MYIGRSAPFFQTARTPRLVLQPPPEMAARRYIASPGIEPVTAGFLRAAVAALHAQPAPVRQQPPLLGVLSRRPVPNRLQSVFLGGQRSTASPTSAHTPHIPTADTGQGRNPPETPRVSVCSFHGQRQQTCLRLIPASCPTKNKKTLRKREIKGVESGPVIKINHSDTILIRSLIIITLPRRFPLQIPATQAQDSYQNPITNK